VGLDSPEEQLEKFLAAQPSWERKILQFEPLSTEEIEAWVRCDWWWTLQSDNQIRGDYERLLRQAPSRWSEYRRRAARNALKTMGLPSGRPGRPRKDAEAEELQELHRTMSYGEIAITRLKTGHSNSDAGIGEQQRLALLKERERIRKLVGSRKPRQRPPEKN
jgi:hypothetical protein